MPDSSEIDYVSRIDYSKGFQRFHIKWPLKNLTRPKVSSSFETTVTDGDRSITLFWSLGVRDSSKYPTDTWVGTRLKSSGKRTPMIYRICLSLANNVLFDTSGFTVIDGTTSTRYGHHVLSSDLDAYPVDDLVLQFWMDIPNAVAVDNISDKLEEANGQNSTQKANIDAFLFDHAKIFSRVVGTNSDPSSDFSVIIVNENDEELRRFHCHSIFLSARSDVFETMFALDEWKENSVKDGRSVKIKDISAQVMETVLQYIYTSTLPDPSIDHDHLCGIIFAADKYNLKDLMNWCVGILIHGYDSIEDRIDQLIFADRHNLTQLKSVCIDQLSFGFSSFSDLPILKEISIEVWAEIMKDMSGRQMETTHITLPAA